MIYMKIFHPFLAPYLEPAIDKVVSLIWGPQAVQRGCPIKPKGGNKTVQEASSGEGDVASTSKATTTTKTKDD